MNYEKLIEDFLYKIKRELTDIRMEFNIPINEAITPKLIGRLDKIHNWIDDIILNIEAILK